MPGLVGVPVGVDVAVGGTGVPVGVSVAVNVGVTVNVAVGGSGVRVGVGVAVNVGVAAICVGVGDDVEVGGTAVCVRVAVAGSVGVGVRVAVGGSGVAVCVAVAVGGNAVGVHVGVWVTAGVAVMVAVGVGVAVPEACVPNGARHCFSVEVKGLAPTTCSGFGICVPWGLFHHESRVAPYQRPVYVPSAAFTQVSQVPMTVSLGEEAAWSGRWQFASEDANGPAARLCSGLAG